MSNIPSDLKFTQDHEWIRDNADGTITVGVTDHAQELLGDLVFVEVPEVGRELAHKEACAVVESVKSASDVYAPCAGTVTEANEALADSPETVNGDAYGEGWLFKLRPADATALEELLDAAAYERLLEDEG